MDWINQVVMSDWSRVAVLLFVLFEKNESQKNMLLIK